MPKFHVTKSIDVAAKPATIFSKINDFNCWREWSPWLIMEKEAEVNVREDGKQYKWKGNRIGSGEMVITAEEENEKIFADLTFITPFKSYAKIQLHLQPKGDMTRVTWEMDSSLPFFMFWMKKMMVAFIGMDFQRGLNMLKELAEVGSVSSELTIEGIKKYEGQTYIGITMTTAMSKMGDSMSEGFGQIEAYIKEQAITPSGPPLAIYHKWDMIGQKATYTMACPVSEIPSNLTGQFKSGEIPAVSVHKVIHKGKYDHLGNAWSLQHMMLRNKEFKQHKKIDPFEVYLNDPANTKPEEYLTAILFPVK